MDKIKERIRQKLDTIGPYAIFDGMWDARNEIEGGYCFLLPEKAGVGVEFHSLTRTSTFPPNFRGIYISHIPAGAMDSGLEPRDLLTADELEWANARDLSAREFCEMQRSDRDLAGLIVLSPEFLGEEFETRCREAARDYFIRDVWDSLFRTRPAEVSEEEEEVETMPPV